MNNSDRREQLTNAIRVGNLVNLRALLEDEQDGCLCDYDLDLLLSDAAIHGCVESCRLIWARISPSGKQMYTGVSEHYFYPITHALECGRLEVVRLFIQEFNFNVNQLDHLNRTPLVHVANFRGDSHGVEEMCRFLLDAGAQVNRLDNSASFGDPPEIGSLFSAVRGGNVNVVRLLLDHGADPNLNRRPVNEEDEDSQQRQNPLVTDHAIESGNAEILRVLLQHGAFVGGRCSRFGSLSETSLNALLHDDDFIAQRTSQLQRLYEPSLHARFHSYRVQPIAFPTSRESRLNVLNVLMEHAKVDIDTAAFIQYSFTESIKVAALNQNIEYFLQAGMDPNKAMYCAVEAENLSVCQLLVREYQVDPFFEHESSENDDVDDNNNNNDYDESTPVAAASPFLAAARLENTGLLEYFLGVWDERFSSSTTTGGGGSGDGKNSNGDYPLHIACCDALVSLQAVKVLVNRQADVLAVVDGEQGLLPLHFSANWGASLDVIFYLLQQCPNALCRGGNATVAAAAAAAAGTNIDAGNFPTVGRSGSTTGMVETSSDDDNKQENVAAGDGPAKKKAKARHST